MWEDLAVVELFHYFSGQEFVGVSEALDDWLQLFDDFEHCFVVFQIVLDHDSQQFGLTLLFESGRLNFEFQYRRGTWVVPPLDGWLGDVVGEEDGVVGFGGIRDEVVDVEVMNEVVEFCLCECLKCCNARRRDDECGVVCVRVHTGDWDSVDDIVSV